MIDVPCILLGIYPQDGWLVAFDDPARGLNHDSPCYIPEYCVYGFAFAPHDPLTGELGNTTAYGYGFIRLADNLWKGAHNLMDWLLRARHAKRTREKHRQTSFL